MPDETPPANPFFSDEPPRTMEREEVEKLLRGGIDGVKEFNRRRASGWMLGDLKGINLEKESCAFLDGNKVFAADLRGAKLRDGTFSGAYLLYTNLSGADLSGANFSDTLLLQVNLSGADLVSANFTGAKLTGANLTGAKLLHADLSGAHLFGANLSGANLRNANLSGANFWMANLSGARLLHANLSSARLLRANLSGAQLGHANLSGAQLWHANLSDAGLHVADLTDADLRESVGLRLDDTMNRNARFDANARDPWSVLRRAYTGPSLLFRLVPMAAYFALLASRAAFWAGFGRAEQRAAEAIAAGANHAVKMPAGQAIAGAAHESMNWMTNHMVSRSVLSVVLGVDGGWLIAALTAALVLYNVMLYFISRAVSAMRDAEERSGYSPAWRVEKPPTPDLAEDSVRKWSLAAPRWAVGAAERWLTGFRGTRHVSAIRRWLIGYQWCWQMHQIMQPLLWASIFAAAWRVFGWLATEVRMPV